MLLRHSPNNVCYSRIVRSASIPNNGHLTLVMLAAAFLVGICVHESHPLAAPSPAPVAPPAQALIALTTSEVRHLLACLYLRSTDLSVVVVATRASVLGRLLSSSASPES